MNRRFEGRHVVVTGGTGALGTAVVQKLLDNGAVCHIPCFDLSELEDFGLADCERVHVLERVDLMEERNAITFYRDLPQLWASIHCTGGFSMSELAQTSLDDFQGQFVLNAVTCFLCCREAVRKIRMTRDATGGRLVNVAARPALEPRMGAGMAAYTAAKSVVAALTQSLGEELAPESIWVNAVAPSIMDTPANRRAMPDADHSSWPSVESVAETIVFLASPSNQSTRAAVVPVYGKS